MPFAGEDHRDIALVGGSHNSERPDLLMLYEFGGYALKDKFAPVWQREAHPGFALAGLGAFLVIESRTHAQARGAKCIARLSAVLSDRSFGAKADGAAVPRLGVGVHVVWSRMPEP